MFGYLINSCIGINNSQCSSFNLAFCKKRNQIALTFKILVTCTEIEQDD